MHLDKIILVTNAPQGKGLAWFYFRALKDINAAADIVILSEEKREYSASVLKRGIRKINYKLGSISKNKRINIEKELVDGQNFVLLFNNSDLLPKDIILLSENKNITLANYFSDHLYALTAQNTETAFTTIPFFDIIFTFATDLLPLYYQHGAKLVKRLPFAYCKYTHLNPIKNINPEFHDKLFYFGTHTLIIENLLSKIDNLINLEIEGIGWINSKHTQIKKKGTKDKPQIHDAMTVFARKAGAVINFTRAPHGCFHTMKTFELAIAKAANITNYSREQEEFFSKDSFLYFNTVDEMNLQIKKALHDHGLNNEIREKAFEQALPHSYHKRAVVMLEHIFDL